LNIYLLLSYFHIEAHVQDPDKAQEQIYISGALGVALTTLLHALDKLALRHEIARQTLNFILDFAPRKLLFDLLGQCFSIRIANRIATREGVTEAQDTER
jgi:hypothetical protein